MSVVSRPQGLGWFVTQQALTDTPGKHTVWLVEIFKLTLETPATVKDTPRVKTEQCVKKLLDGKFWQGGQIRKDSQRKGLSRYEASRAKIKWQRILEEGNHTHHTLHIHTKFQVALISVKSTLVPPPNTSEGPQMVRPFNEFMRLPRPLFRKHQKLFSRHAPRMEEMIWSYLVSNQIRRCTDI